MDQKLNKRALLDDIFPDNERLPRQLEISFREQKIGDAVSVSIYYEGNIVGDRLTDNSNFEDFFRFHDVFHLANAAILGWSPCLRRILRCKRRSNFRVDEVEDGGRAVLIEEAVAAIMHKYARREICSNTAIDMISILTVGLEVETVGREIWYRTLSEGNRVFDQLVASRGGQVICDLYERSLVFI
ncbi:MAG: hypothetical protein M3Q07_12945, partial [Pseudobdellovibrionaceae bacterium]|nr:hypothetical protein [Pseudobdellovibrionaceae bacterium]